MCEACKIERRERGRQGASARHTPEVYARSIARRWPDLDPDTRVRVRELLVPVLGGGR